MSAIAGDPISKPVVSPSSFDEPWVLDVVVRAEVDEAPLARQPLTEADLAEARSEAWFRGLLRRGRHDVPFEDLESRLAPITRKDRCLGFVLETSGPGSPDRTYHSFGVSCAAPVAQRLAEKLVDQGVLAEGDTYAYDLEPRRGSAPPPPRAGGLRITTRTAPLKYAGLPLSPVLAAAEAVGTIDDDSFPVFFGRDALTGAEHFSRTGAACRPPVESGAMLIGRLCACPDTGEMFVTVHDAFEVFDAAQREFALILTGATWKQVEAVLRRFRDGDGPGLMRLVGQAHGHNFELQGEPCAVCHEARECGRTTVFVSAEDRRFMRTVFARQPWALCWIAGSNARGDRVAKLYTLRGGSWQERGYHVVDELPGGSEPNQ